VDKLPRFDYDCGADLVPNILRPTTSSPDQEAEFGLDRLQDFERRDHIGMAVASEFSAGRQI
jgi:hypothetical protein